SACLAAARARLLETVHTHFAISCGLFTGRAGALFALTGEDRDPALVRPHLDALGWEAMAAEPGRGAFRGDHGYPPSTDLATGSAGVLLARAARDDDITALPFLGGTPAPAYVEAA